MSIDQARLEIHPEVKKALAKGGAVVALESTIISHGLPSPRNVVVAGQIEQNVRDGGAIPATIAIIGGVVKVGLSSAELEILGDPASDVVKVSTRDLGPVLAAGRNGATTVSATSHIAHLAGIKYFATGGLGGVHRGAQETYDESADLVTLARTPITVVCAGVKSILDVAATLERLETLGVTVVGFGTDAFPGFYRADSGYGVTWRVDTAAEAAAIGTQRDAIRAPGAVIIAQPVSEADQLDLELHDRVLTQGLAAATSAHIVGKDVTPFLLDWFHTQTDNQSLEVNVTLINANARLAAQIAVAATK
ncbi:MAG: Pseudouridine-5-phosphate glycosidase [Actinomycetota bacterium]|jgi:pseudouridine-5'-phosphate glycosidase